MLIKFIYWLFVYYKVYFMVYNTPKDEIVRILKKEGTSTREEIAKNLKHKPNRAILMGYLRCLSDLAIIKSKNAGKAKIYFMKRGNDKWEYEKK